MGYAACQIATKDNFMQGNIGAGCGATVGKIFGIKNAMKSGLGTASIRLGNNVTIGALAAVNAFGDVVNKERKIIAGAQKIIKNISKNETIFADTLSIMNSLVGQGIFKLAERQNTIIGVVATNAKLTKDQANKFAESASDGITLSVQPAFTMLDGDTVFALSTGSKSMDINILCAYAPVVFADAIRNAVNSADPAGGLPSVKSLTGMNNDKNNS
jgi:L-aminopeptidase/D-esterase-like protein